MKSLVTTDMLMKMKMMNQNFDDVQIAFFGGSIILNQSYFIYFSFIL